MFRTTVLSIALTLAVAPNATVVCALWCHPDEARTMACEHQGASTSPRLTETDSCRPLSATTTPFVREAAKRGQQASQLAAAVPQFRFVPETTVGSGPYTALATASPPVLVALRL